MVGFVFGYVLNGFMFVGVYICIDTDLICYLIFVLMIVGYLCPLYCRWISCWFTS
jgi:NhaP-type Na+/H+ or K+/H+ antiporter